MWTLKLTLAALAVAFGVLSYAEFRALLDNRKGDTISEQVWKVNDKTPLLAFMSGFLAGHLFWQSRR